ncbi:MAG: molybdenum cofactor guanylyltransferase [bacterium]|nr:molybdenum cofactor guanylyltransferase [bacterium]
MLKVSGAILAGGQSSRMGKDKANLSFQGTTLLQRMEKLLQKSGVAHTYISRADKIADRIPGYGPLSGIHSILKGALGHSSHLIFVPIDMPTLSVALIKQLLITKSESPLTYFDQYALPFKIEVDPTWITLIEKTFKEGKEHSLRAFQNQIDSHTLKIDPSEADCFANINTPDEWGKYTGEKA